MTHKHRADDLEDACEMAISHDAYRLRALRDLMKQPSHQLKLIQNHPLIRPMDAYARQIKVSFRQDGGGNKFPDFDPVIHNPRDDDIPVHSPERTQP